MPGAKRKDSQKQQQQPPKHRRALDAADDESFSRKRSRGPKSHQREEKLISSGMSSKILKEALNQQREIEREEEEENPNAFSSITKNPSVAVQEEEEEEDDIDGFDGFSETQSLYDGGNLQEIDEEDERVLATFMSESAGPQLTVADIIIQKIKEEYAEVALGPRSSNMNESWVHKYKPHFFTDLAIHKKKVDEVKGWLEERLTSRGGSGNSTLLITGQTGVGKSAVIHVVASELGAELFEWTTPTPTLWQEHIYNRNSGRTYMSNLEEFERFTDKVRKYCLLHPSFSGGSRKPIVVLIDDLPVTSGRIALQRLKKCLATLVNSSQTPTIILLTEYNKTEFADTSTNYLEELRSTLENAGAREIAFNPLTVNSIKKALSRICEEEKCVVTAEWIAHIARTSGGDIRHAITSLQYLCLRRIDAALFMSIPHKRQSATSADKCNSLLSPSLTCQEDLDIRPSLCRFGRDETLTLFHVLGRFLHNKRSADESARGQRSQYSFFLHEKLSRNPLKMDPLKKVLSQAHEQARNIADFLHENALDFIGDEATDDAWLVTSYLSDADVVLGGAVRPTRSMLSEPYQPGNLVHSIAASVAARGVLFGISHPSPSRWHTIRSPRLWQVEQSSRDVKSQMKKERLEGINDSNWYNVFHFTFDDRSTIRWLRSKTSDVHHIPHSGIWLDDELVDDDAAWMDQDMVNIYNEECKDLWGTFL